jgi:hypothetical protein
MAQYKIKVILHQLKSNKLGKAGEIVEESQLLSPASELVKNGFIELVGVEDEANDDLAKMTIPELKQFADQNVIDVEGLTKKKAILAAIKSHINNIEIK